MPEPSKQMIGLDGYTLCSGIICEELNGDDFVAIPFEYEDPEAAYKVMIGYSTEKNMLLSQMGELYISEIKSYLGKNEK